MDEAQAIWQELSNQKFMPFYQCATDPAGVELDERIAKDLLGLGEDAVASVARLRTLLAVDPSIRGFQEAGGAVLRSIETLAYAHQRCLGVAGLGRGGEKGIRKVFAMDDKHGPSLSLVGGLSESTIPSRLYRRDCKILTIRRFAKPLNNS